MLREVQARALDYEGVEKMDTTQFKVGDKVRSTTEMYNMTAAALGFDVTTPPGDIGTIRYGIGDKWIVMFPDGSWSDFQPEWYELIGE